MSDVTRVYEGLVYHKGSNTDLNFTPRPDRDVSNDLQAAGLSTWRELNSTLLPGAKGQEIDLARLDHGVLGCFEDDHGHVSIVPVDSAGNLDMMTLADWAASRGSAHVHPLTTLLLNAVVRCVWRSP